MNIKGRVIVLILSLPFLLAQPVHAAPHAVGKIIVSGKQLIDSATGQPFVVRSVQYQRYNTPAVEADYAKMQELGYNAARIFVNVNDPGNYLNTLVCRNADQSTYKITDCISQAYLESIVQEIRWATSHYIKIILTFGEGVPYTYDTVSDGQNWGNTIYKALLKEEDVRNNGRFLNDALNYFKSQLGNLDGILMVQPMPEPSFDTNFYPWTVTGKVISYPEFYVDPTKTYTVGPTLKNKVGGQSPLQMKEIITFSFINAFAHWFNRIKEVDASLPVLYEQYPSYAIQNVPNIHINDGVLTSSFTAADILGMQIYPDYLTFVSHPGDTMDTFLTFTPGFKDALLASSKPFLVLEFGIPRTDPQVLTNGQSDPTKASIFLINWQVQTCQYHPVGWGFFNWNYNPPNFPFYTAVENNYLLGNSLSPNYRWDGCIANPNPPPPTPGDLTGDGHVTLADLLQAISSLSIFTYNQVVANFGK